MTKALLKGLLKLITALLSALLTPIDLVVNAFFPDVSGLVSYISNWFDIIKPYFGWVVDASFISREVITFMMIFFTFKLTFWFAVWVIKLAIHWYRKLMP